mgnify:CR=1 FL=1
MMSAALALMAMSANAQSMKRINMETTAKTWVETATPQKAAKKIATRAGELEANQRYINYSYDESYVWPSTFPADTQGAISLGTLFYSDAFKKYEGCKIVGARFYVNIPIGASKVGICHVKIENNTPYVGDILASKEVPSTVAHWNYVWFDEPYKIDTKNFDGLLPYYDFTPSNMSADAGYPIASSGTYAGTCGALAYGDVDGKHDQSSWAWQPIYIGTDGSNLMIQLIIEKNNLHDFDTWIFFKWIFKTFCAVLIVTNTWNIVMGIFDVGQSVVNSSAGVIIGNTSIDISSVITDMEAQLEVLGTGELFGLWFQSLFVGLTMNALSICIMLVIYGRMIEVYLTTSVGPIPLATMTNRDWSHTGQNYLKSLFALAFQAFLIMVCVGIYSVLVQSIATDGNISGAIWACMGYTVLLCFALFKTGSLSKSLFGAH